MDLPRLNTGFKKCKLIFQREPQGHRTPPDVECALQNTEGDRAARGRANEGSHFQQVLYQSRALNASNRNELNEQIPV